MGVKSLWTLLTPVGRPVMLETVEGKAMAIDSSIWIYQFQATMRDKEGRALVNAHVLGFLRRISKLLFYGIKPVFVFDGGAPALKRTTLNERRTKKSGAAASHVKVAAKLLAAQMRREALNHAQDATLGVNSKRKAVSGEIPLDDNTVYLEDLENITTKTPKKAKQPTPSSSSTKINKYRDHDPYRLPQIDMEEVISNARQPNAPDPRLATEEELRLFIEEMKPEDFDVNSPAFRDLPTEIKYEIVGDLRLKSRQTSYARLQKMLQTSRTPLDFSKQQIQNLRQRNALTQQLLTTTDSIGSAHIAIPVRIASERNKEYVLVKNEGESGGWILGIRDTGTREKPITIDHDDEQPTNEDDDSEADMEEVMVPKSATPDPDLRDYQREMALSTRQLPKEPLALPINRKTKTKLPHFSQPEELSDSENDMLAIAVQRSLEDSNSKASHSSPRLGYEQSSQLKMISSSDRLYEKDQGPASHTRLETALSIAGVSPSRIRLSTTEAGTISTLFGRPTLLSSSPKGHLSSEIRSETDKTANASAIEVSGRASSNPEDATVPSLFGPPVLLPTLRKGEASKSASIGNRQGQSHLATAVSSSQADVSPVAPDSRTQVFIESTSDLDEDADLEEVPVDVDSGIAMPVDMQHHSFTAETSSRTPQPQNSLFTINLPTPSYLDNLEGGGSRESSPPRDPFGSQPLMPSHQEEEWDAANEVDVRAEEGEFARFMSHVKGRNIDDIRKEIDDEIKHLNQQRKAALRDSEDITQQMITQIMTMLRLFGIPYITAPMEAEAQCAELVSLNLVDGVITDDSDVFLFGAKRVYKNMFNQSKTVECFLLSDLFRELGLDRDALIRLAYLLGSDYTEGLPGVGPVVAMEILKEFPGHGGLHKFKEWWNKVQTGKDKEEDNQSKFRQQLKRKFKDLYLPSDWPNSVVRDAYYHPTVDSSEEPFKWGMPDLDGLRLFFHQELGWKQSKVDDLLLPIVQRLSKRSQVEALNKQGNLNDYLEISAGSGTHAPRQRQAYASKRLQQVITDFRKRQKRSSLSSASQSGSGATSQDDDRESDNNQTTNTTKAPAAKKRKTVTTRDTTLAQTRRSAMGSLATVSTRRSKGKARTEASVEDSNMSDTDDEDGFVPPRDVVVEEPDVERNLRPRPKPRPLHRGQNETKPLS